MSIEEFCYKHQACREGRLWALDNCKTMTEAWSKIRPDWLAWVATRAGVLSAKEARLFAVFCARMALSRIAQPDFRSIEVVNVAEKFARGEASEEELSAAGTAALAASDEAFSTALDAAVAAHPAEAPYVHARIADNAVETVVAKAAHAVTNFCPHAAAHAASTYAASYEKQERYLREHCKPIF